MQVGNVCKVSAIIVFSLDFIGSIIIAAKTENFMFFLIGFLSSFLFCLVLYALGEIVDQLEISNNNTYQLYKMLKSKEAKDSAPASPSQTSTPSSAPARSVLLSNTGKDSWVCRSCGTRNSNTDMSCRECGKYK